MTPDLPRGGFTIREYERRVWDMARHLIHPTFLYVVVFVAAGTRLSMHALYSEAGVGGVREGALFLAGFLGAWACFYSTLLRDSGLRSVAVTVLVPLAAATAVVVFAALPGPSEMTREQAVWASLALASPGPVAWALTMLRWRRARREADRLLAQEARP